MFILFPLVAFAGGLGISPVLAVSGGAALIGLHPKWISELRHKMPTALWLVLLLLLWGVISTIWSPYQSDDVLNNPTKLLIGVPLFLSCAAVIKHQAAHEAKILTRTLISGLFLTGIAIIIDFLSDYKLTFTFSPLAPGEDMTRRIGDLIQNLGHGVSVLALLMVPVVIMLWRKGSVGKALALAAIALVFVCGLVSGLNSSILAAAAGIVFVGLAVVRPYLAVRMSFVFAGFTLVFAPMLAFFSTKMSASMKAALPFSWEERVETWAYMLDKITAHPFIGHGFDAVRTFNDKHTIRGYEDRALVSLHPHNAGLHLWAELGLVGVGIACAALFYGARHLVHPGRLTSLQMIAVSGFVASATVMASVSYGVWQDWWWAAIIFASAQILLISNPRLST